MKKLLLLFILPLYLFAQTLQVGNEVVIKKIMSQHDKEYTLIKNGKWVITWDKITTRTANKFFANNLMAKDTNMIVDVSQAPLGIFEMFILPDMRHYKHPILLSYDEIYNVTLPYKENHITILHIKNKSVKKIEFVKTKAELKQALK